MVMKIEPKVCASVSCVLLQDLMRSNIWACETGWGKIPVFVGQHEPESAEASGIVKHS